MGDIAEDETSFYTNAEDYWKEVPPTVDGMLGGYGSISSIDINGSKAFLQKFLGVRNSCHTATAHSRYLYMCQCQVTAVIHLMQSTVL